MARNREPKHRVLWWNGDFRTADRIHPSAGFDTAKEADAEVRRLLKEITPQSTDAYVRWEERHRGYPSTQEARFNGRAVGRGWVWEWTGMPHKLDERKFQKFVGEVQQPPPPETRSAPHPSVNMAEREEHAMRLERDINRALARNSDPQARRDLDNLHASVSGYLLQRPHLQLAVAKVLDWARKHSDSTEGRNILDRAAKRDEQQRLEERFAPQRSPAEASRLRTVENIKAVGGERAAAKFERWIYRYDPGKGWTTHEFVGPTADGEALLAKAQAAEPTIWFRLTKNKPAKYPSTPHREPPKGQTIDAGDVVIETSLHPLVPASAPPAPPRAPTLPPASSRAPAPLGGAQRAPRGRKPKLTAEQSMAAIVALADGGSLEQAAAAAVEAAPAPAPALDLNADKSLSWQSKRELSGVALGDNHAKTLALIDDVKAGKFKPATVPPRALADEPGPVVHAKAGPDLWGYSDEQLDKLYRVASRKRDKSEAERIRANLKERETGPGLSRQQNEMIELVRAANGRGNLFQIDRSSTRDREKLRARELKRLVSRGLVENVPASAHHGQGYALPGWRPALEFSGGRKERAVLQAIADLQGPEYFPTLRAVGERVGHRGDPIFEKNELEHGGWIERVPSEERKPGPVDGQFRVTAKAVLAGFKPGAAGVPLVAPRELASAMGSMVERQLDSRLDAEKAAAERYYAASESARHDALPRVLELAESAPFPERSGHRRWLDLYVHDYPPVTKGKVSAQTRALRKVTSYAEKLSVDQLSAEQAAARDFQTHHPDPEVIRGFRRAVLDWEHDNPRRVANWEGLGWVRRKVNANNEIWSNADGYRAMVMFGGKKKLSHLFQWVPPSFEGEGWPAPNEERAGAGNAARPAQSAPGARARKPPRRGGGPASAPDEGGQATPSGTAKPAKPPKAKAPKVPKPRKPKAPKVAQLKRWTCEGLVRVGCGGGGRVVGVKVPRVKASIFTRI